MKTDELKALGISEDIIAKIMALNGKDIAAEQAKTQAAEAARDNFKGQLDTATTTLKTFEGVDVKELNGKITTLTADLAAQQAKYEGQIADMTFGNSLTEALRKAGAKNVKAVQALLDADALKASKNQAADIEAAIATCKKENDFLFTSEEPIDTKPPIAGAGGNTGKEATGVEALFLAKNPGIKI